MQKVQSSLIQSDDFDIQIQSSHLLFNNHITAHQFSSVQLFSHVQLFVTPCTIALQTSLSITTSWSLLKLVSIESVMPSNHLILCRKELYTTEQLNWTEDLFTPLLKSFLLSAPGNKLGMSPVTINWEGVFIF